MGASLTAGAERDEMSRCTSCVLDSAAGARGTNCGHWQRDVIRAVELVAMHILLCAAACGRLCKQMALCS